MDIIRGVMAAATTTTTHSSTPGRGLGLTLACGGPRQQFQITLPRLLLGLGRCLPH